MSVVVYGRVEDQHRLVRPSRSVQDVAQVDFWNVSEVSGKKNVSCNIKTGVSYNWISVMYRKFLQRKMSFVTEKRKRVNYRRHDYYYFFYGFFSLLHIAVPSFFRYFKFLYYLTLTSVS